VTLTSVEARTSLDLFSGIGGFSLGLERAGFHTVAFCENNVDCQRVLAHHWPEVPIFGDVHELTAKRLGRRVELIAGGFPCQPHSSASRGRKVARDLWPEFLRLVRECRPDWVAAENVPGIGHDGVDRVSRDLEALGYEVWPFDLDTALPQRQRGRIRFIWLAHANGNSQRRFSEHEEVAVVPQIPRRREADHRAPLGVDDGLPQRMARLHALGNALTPTIAELIGRAILRAHRSDEERSQP
jgi:DNA (cytosine-5)-methyltransferase 1